VSPANTTKPITCTWSPVPASGQGTTGARYAWTTAGTQTITITAHNAGGAVRDTHAATVVVRPRTVQIAGPTQGLVNVTYPFTATVNPSNTTLPITYTWAPEPMSGQGTANAGYSWATEGTQTITIAASNVGGTVHATHTVAITPRRTYLPITFKE
jgi:hypothetical protein